MSYRQSDFWTPDRTERLVVMWTDGVLSAGQIAGLFARQECRAVSRNAILGKVHRMKLPHRIEGRGPRAAPQKPRKKRIPAPRNIPPDEAFAVAEPVPVFVKDVARLQLIELTDATCKWPVGDPLQPGFGFCGLPAADGHVYCPTHHHRSIRPPRPVSVEERAHAVA
jgi:GcrA cell cycle regulator